MKAGGVHRPVDAQGWGAGNEEVFILPVDWEPLKAKDSTPSLGPQLASQEIHKTVSWGDPGVQQGRQTSHVAPGKGAMGSSLSCLACGLVGCD